MLQAVRDMPGNRQLVILRVEDAFDPSWWLSTDGRVPDDMYKLSGSYPWRDSSKAPVLHLRGFLNALPTSSAKSYMLLQLSRLLLLHTARRLKCSAVLLGDTLTSLSISLISAIASGDGFHVGTEREEQWGSIKVIKPLRDISAKECAASFYWRNLREICPSKPHQDESSIGQVTRGQIHILRSVHLLNWQQ